MYDRKNTSTTCGQILFHRGTLIMALVFREKMCSQHFVESMSIIFMEVRIEIGF